MTAADILTSMASVVSGDRQKTHGEKERSFAVIADFWNTYILGKKEFAWIRDGLAGKPLITAVDAPQMMVLQKIARSIQGEPVADHFADECGYAAIAGEIASANDEPAVEKEQVAARTSRYEDEPDGCHLCGGKGECEPGCMLDKKRGCVGPKSVIDALRSTLGIHETIAETETASVSMNDCRITVQEGDMPESGEVLSPCAFLAAKG